MMPRKLENKRLFSISVLVIAGTAIVISVLSMWFDSRPVESTTPSMMVGEEKGEVLLMRTTMSGTYVDCLPLHDNFSEKICIAGFRAEDGSYYAIDFSLLSETKPELKQGSKFSANGIMTPIEMLSANQWREVVGRGVFSVTDSVVIK